MGEHVAKQVKSERFKTPEQIFNPDNAGEFGRLLGDRYRDRCVIWYLGGDRNPTDETAAIWDAMALGLKKGSTNRHLVSYHGARKSSSSPMLHQRPWLDFNTIQSGHHSAEPNYLWITEDRQLRPPKPTLDMEARYEDHIDGLHDGPSDPSVRIDAHQVREAAYWAILAGAAGHGYGHNSIWQFHDERHTDADYSFPSVPATVSWIEAMDADGAFGMSHWRYLVESVPWYELEPALPLVIEGQGGGNAHIQVARSSDRGVLLAYLPAGGSLTIDSSEMASSTVSARWYDPRTGVFSEAGVHPTSDRSEFAAPTAGPRQDWVLVLAQQ